MKPKPNNKPSPNLAPERPETPPTADTTAAASSNTSARRSLTHIGGSCKLWGDPELGEILREALDVPSSVGSEETGAKSEGEIMAREHVHGFHAYPARMHPRTARRLVEGLSQPGEVVLDPFCGSGTVVVEAKLLGRRARGIDLNPLAIAIATRKATAAVPAARTALAEAARRCQAVANFRRENRVGASRRYPDIDVEMFDPHVLLELDGLRVGIDSEQRGLQSDLELILSAILVKFSRQRSDTRGELAKRRIAAGYVAKFFVKKTDELCAALAEVETALRAAPKALLKVADARALEMTPNSVDLIVTSPPYAGVYDYVEHHSLRLRWLNLPDQGMRNSEIGSRRRLSRLPAYQARLAYGVELGAALAAQAEVLRMGGRAVWLIADSGFGDTALRADEEVAHAGRLVGLEAIAVASQERPHFHGRSQAAFEQAPRLEHAILLEKQGAPRSAGGSPRQRNGEP